MLPRSVRANIKLCGTHYLATCVTPACARLFMNSETLSELISRVIDARAMLRVLHIRHAHDVCASQ